MLEKSRICVQPNLRRNLREKRLNFFCAVWYHKNGQNLLYSWLRSGNPHNATVSYYVTAVGDYNDSTVVTANCLRPTLRPTVQKRKLVHLHCSIRAGSEMGQEGVFVLRSKRAEPDPTESAAHKFCGKIRSDFSNCDIIISGKNLYLVWLRSGYEFNTNTAFHTTASGFYDSVSVLTPNCLRPTLRPTVQKRKLVHLHCSIRAGSEMGQEGVLSCARKRAETDPTVSAA